MMLKTTLYASALAMLCLGTPSQAVANPRHSKIDRGLQESLRKGESTDQVIITFNPGCRAGWRSALEQHGDVINGDHPLINALSGVIHSQDVVALATNDCVRAVSSDATLHADGLPGNGNGFPSGNGKGTSPTGSGSQTQSTQPSQTLTSTLRDTLGLPHISWLDPSVPTGDGGITVAVIDSGISPSADFGKRIIGFWDFTRGGQKVAAYDDFGHGTHVAGLIGSSGRLSNYEFQGIAPDVRLVGLKVLDASGSGRTSDVIRAIEFVIANKSSLGIKVINLSLGHPVLSDAADDPLVQAVEQASAAGLIVVASAGNFGQKQSDGSVGYMGITSPGNAPSAITVGAAMTQDTVRRDDDQVAPYSSRGPTWFDAYAKPDVVAPGHHLASDTNLSSYLYTLLDHNRAQSDNGQPLLELSGSSMATAVTSGVVALILDAHSDNGFAHQKALTPNLVKGILEYSAIPINGADFLTQGAGEINAAGAIDLARFIDTSRPLGSTWLQGITPASIIGGATDYWSQHIIYGDTVLGGNVLATNDTVWSSNIVWGTNIVWSTAADIEADNIVWGTNVVWGSNIVWSTIVIGERVDPGNIAWGTNIVWGTLTAQNVVWGQSIGADADNIVWGTSIDGELDNIVWGTAILFGGVR